MYIQYICGFSSFQNGVFHQFFLYLARFHNVMSIIRSQKIKPLYSVLALIVLIMVLFMYLPGWVFAQFGIGDPFGGLVLFSIPCPCSGGTMITVGPPRPGIFMIDAGSVIYEKFAPLPGHWVLGLADAFEPCLVPSGPFGGCLPIGGGGRVRIMGTS